MLSVPRPGITHRLPADRGRLARSLTADGDNGTR